MDQSKSYLNSLLKDEDIILLGCSGGPDSMVLLNLLLDIRKNINIKLVVACVDHNVRKESKDELLFVKDYCKNRKVIFEEMTIDKYSDDNFENEARSIRYSFFNDLIKKYGCNYLMTAHHGDDLMETILMRIVRGSTLSGYSGFSLVSNMDGYKIVRPLIFTTKEEIINYAEGKGIPFVIDKTNFLDTHTRNRYRKVVLPFLKKEDKNVHLKFLKYSNLLQMYDKYINSIMKDTICDVILEDTIDINKYKELDYLLQYEVIYKELERYYQDDLILISDVHVNMIRDLLYSKKANCYVYLPNNVKVVKSYDKLYFDKDVDLIDGYEIEISDFVHLPNNKDIKRIDSSDTNDNNYCRLNSCDVLLPLRVRTRKSGDKIKVKNMTGSKKVNDIFIDKKIPLKDRDLWPVVVDSNDEIVWIPGLKKSKYDVPKSKKCDIILKYN